MLAGLVEHESCIGLTHYKCWNPKSKLKTAREEGAGFGQITRAYRQNGTIRFDALAELKHKYPKELYEWNWSNVYDRPDLQLRGLVLKSKDNYVYYKKYTDTINALYFADAAYNGGIAGLDRERAACYLSKTCDSTKWFDNVERFCLKSNVAIYGTRSACEINRHHVYDVFINRSFKYKKVW